MSKSCKLCGQYFKYDKIKHVYPELLLLIFDKNGKHVLSIGDKIAGWGDSNVVCVYCLKNLREFFEKQYKEDIAAGELYYFMLAKQDER